MRSLFIVHWSLLLWILTVFAFVTKCFYQLLSAFLLSGSFMFFACLESFLCAWLHPSLLSSGFPSRVTKLESLETSIHDQLHVILATQGATMGKHATALADQETAIYCSKTSCWPRCWTMNRFSLHVLTPAPSNPALIPQDSLAKAQAQALLTPTTWHNLQSHDENPGGCLRFLTWCSDI